MNVSTPAAMREMDRHAIEECGIPELLLMEHAGQAAIRVIGQDNRMAGQRWLILCGSGNNGGDGLVVARLLHSHGAIVEIFLIGNREKFGQAAATNLSIVDQMGLEIIDDCGVDEVAQRLDVADGIVDALFGTGISRDVEGKYAGIIQAVNRADKPVVSLDIPSGINGDTGQIMGVAISAHQTITFGLPKAGNLLYPGFAQGGSLSVSYIGFPPSLYAAPDSQLALNQPARLPQRDADGHKGTFGDTLFVAGAAAYYGAPYFAAASFMAAGGGYPRLATPRSVAPIIANHAPELVFMPQDETEEGTLAKSNGDALLVALDGLDFAVIGPGTSRQDETQALLLDLMRHAPTPILVDGDGITAACRDLDAVRSRSALTVLTPHLGEMARLTGKSTQEIIADRVGVLQQTCADLETVIVLKGAHTLIGYPDGRVLFNLTGNAGMATAGSGDVLTGVIAAMSGLGLPFDEAVATGVAIHGLAGDIAAQEVGQDGMTANSILAALPAAMRQVRSDNEWFTPYTFTVV